MGEHINNLLTKVRSKQYEVSGDAEIMKQMVEELNAGDSGLDTRVDALESSMTTAQSNISTAQSNINTLISNNRGGIYYATEESKTSWTSGVHWEIQQGIPSSNTLSASFAFNDRIICDYVIHVPAGYNIAVELQLGASQSSYAVDASLAAKTVNIHEEFTNVGSGNWHKKHSIFTYTASSGVMDSGNSYFVNGDMNTDLIESGYIINSGTGIIAPRIFVTVTQAHTDDIRYTACCEVVRKFVA